MWQIISAYIEGIITIIFFYIFCIIILKENIKVSKTKFVISIIITSLLNGFIRLIIAGTTKTLIIVIIDILFVLY